MEEKLSQQKLEAIATYLAENISQAHIKIQDLQAASPVYVLLIRTPKQLHRLGVSRPLIEDQNRSVSEVQRLMLRDGLADRVQSFNRDEYFWNPQS